MNKKILFGVATLLFTFGAGFYFLMRTGREKQQVEPEDLSSNPAAFFCEEQGGRVQNIPFDTGVRGFCVFEDGSQCAQWDFYNQRCDKGQLKVEVLEKGSGTRVDNEDVVSVHYVGRLEDGTKFDSSIDRGESFSFTLGAGEVISGWDQGVLGMQVGEKRRLTIGPALGYGENGVPGVIPPDSVLIFEVELLEIGGHGL